MRFRLAILSLLVACVHRSPSAPPPRGMIAGMVRDGLSGRGVGDAVLVLRRPGQIDPTQDHTTGDGAYMIPDLPVGTYAVAAYVQQRLIGERDVEVKASQIIGVDFTVPAAGVDLPDPNAPGAPELWRFRAPDADPAIATIEGTVADIASHQRLESAVVTVTRTGALDTVQAITDAQGRFQLAGLAPGEYDVSAYYTVLHRGQLEVRRSRVAVAGGETVVVPLWLETGGL